MEKREIAITKAIARAAETQTNQTVFMNLHTRTYFVVPEIDEVINSPELAGPELASIFTTKDLFPEFNKE